MSKPATALVEKVSAAVGGLFRPVQVTRMAKAQAKAALIKAESDINVTDLHRRAIRRWVEEEARDQANMERIVSDALPLLGEHPQPEVLHDDWIVNFFDKCRIVSDREMQALWSRVLAGQANNPGTFSRRTINLMGDLEKRDAEAFMRLCGFSLIITRPVPLVFDVKARIYNENGIDFEVVKHLESLGLIHYNGPGYYEENGLPETIEAAYHGRKVELKLQHKRNSLKLGHVLFTMAGEELAPISGAMPVPGFLEYAATELRPFGVLGLRARGDSDDSS